QILCVDHDAKIVRGIRAYFNDDYDISIATSISEGQALLAAGDFAVVLVALRMPGQSGTEFLRHVRERAPHTQRMIIAEDPEGSALVEAVNTASVNFVTQKPVNPTELARLFADAVRLHAIAVTDRDRLEDTSSGVVELLSEVMSVAAPRPLSRANAVEAYVLHMCKSLGVTKTGAYQLAALLGRLGCIALHPQTLDRHIAGQTIDPKELRLLETHPAVGARLLRRIPDLQQVAAIVELQHAPPHWDGELPQGWDQEITFGANLLAVAQAMDDRILLGDKAKDATAHLRRSAKHLNRKLLLLLDGAATTVKAKKLHSFAVAELAVGMVLDQDVATKAGKRLLRRGGTLTPALIERLRNFSQSVGVSEPIRVRVPAELLATLEVAQ
ncbi:MAG: HD domain-containing phosphohydrolase, partial [Myxococcota bacterium]